MSVWADKQSEAHYRFRVQLEGTALHDLLDDVPRLKALRYDIEALRRMKKMLKHALFETKVDLDREVYRASEPPETEWDSEDEEKHAGPPPAPPSPPPPRPPPPEPEEDIEALRAKRLAHFGKI